MTRTPIDYGREVNRLAKRAARTIVFFAVCYLLLLALSMALIAGCVYGAVFLVSNVSSIYAILFGLTLVAASVLVFYFLVKFVFKSQKIDRSGMIELAEQEAPRLFTMIKEVVKETDTVFPKKVFLSHEVNASVFYDSTFLSMFLPVRKNLSIGMGLANALTEEELKAVLAHEFGHFSQNSMKIGSYVYTVNRVIYNMLYDNTGYDNILESFNQLGTFGRLTSHVAVAFVRGIQWILQKLYEVVNLNDMKLSRAMEFHADAIAVKVTGAGPFAKGMLRLELINVAMNDTISYYNTRTPATRPDNIYKDQHHSLQRAAKRFKLPVMNGLPDVGMADYKKHNVSKLNVEDQWASHPDTIDRILAAGDYSEARDRENLSLAIGLFDNIEDLQRKLTVKMYADVEYAETPEILSNEQFRSGYDTWCAQDSTPEIFNGYYDYWNPVIPEDTDVLTNVSTIEELFSPDKIELIMQRNMAEKDRDLIERIIEFKSHKSFEYDGERYELSDAQQVSDRISAELKDMDAEIARNNLAIYRFFAGKDTELDQAFQDFTAYDKQYVAAFGPYNKIIERTRFLNDVHEYADIEGYIFDLTVAEKEFKKTTQELLDNPLLQFSEEATKAFNEYLSKEWKYFVRPSYLQPALDVMFDAINAYFPAISENHSRLRKQLLLGMEKVAVAARVEVQKTA